MYVLYKEIEYGRQLKEFIAGFRITVETIEEFLPSVKHRLNDFFYDANSFAEAYYCKWGHDHACIVLIALTMYCIWFQGL